MQGNAFFGDPEIPLCPRMMLGENAVAQFIVPPLDSGIGFVVLARQAT
jgi:hypothetical protein